jgi:hypothetical protein
MDIICINDNFSPEQVAEIPNRPIKDKMYTIRDIVKSANGIGLLLNEIHNPKNGWVVRDGMKFTFEPNFNINRFSDLQNQPLNYETIKQVEKVK